MKTFTDLLRISEFEGPASQPVIGSEITIYAVTVRIFTKIYLEYLNLKARLKMWYF